jgi:hypothetical protein
MNCAQGRLDASAEAQREQAAHVRLEAEIALVRQEIAQLKDRLRRSFEEPGGFVAIGEELRQATERLRLMEAELKTRKLEAREEVWWCSRQPVVAGAAKLPKFSARFGERRLGR